MLRAGIAQRRLVLYYFWHSVMRACYRGDIWLVKLHTHALCKALHYSPFEDRG